MKLPMNHDKHPLSTLFITSTEIAAKRIMYMIVQLIQVQCTITAYIHQYNIQWYTALQMICTLCSKEKVRRRDTKVA